MKNDIIKTKVFAHKGNKVQRGLIERVKTVTLLIIFAMSTGFVLGIKYSHSTDNIINQKVQALAQSAQAQSRTTVAPTITPGK